MSYNGLAVASLAAATLATAGCGGSTGASDRTVSAAPAQVTSEDIQRTDAGTGTSVKPTSVGKVLTRTELTAKAEEICGRIRARISRPHGGAERDIARVAPGLARYERARLAELAKLRPPASLASDWAQVLRGVESLATDAASLGVYAKAHQLATPAGGALIRATGEHGIHESAVARRDGFKTCATAI